jgi:hypothetical protein
MSSTASTISSTTLSSIEPSPRESATRERFERLVDTIVADDGLHARFANTLSLLEHIGSVKIARTQSGPAIDADALQHLAEEARHADVLKRIVGRLAGESLATYGDEELLAGVSARGYFARLDALVRAFCRERLEPDVRHAAAYALVTWLVERRAMWLYPLYQDTLERHAARASVRSIIGEETRHLEDVVAALERIGLGDAADVVEIVRQEESLFARLAGAMEQATNDRAGTTHSEH